MISYFTLGTSQFDKAAAFYGALMKEMGAQQVYAAEKSIGWGWGVGTPMFILIKPFNEEPASAGNGTMISFDAASPAEVDRLHELVLQMGGSNEGAPGMRGEQMYAAYWRDLDGNKGNFIHYLAAAG